MIQNYNIPNTYPGVFMAAVFAELENRGRVSSWNAQQLASAIINLMDGHTAIHPPVAPTPPPPMWLPDDALEPVPDVRLIHEMMRRGFAVMKIPESGKPEALATP